MNDKIYFSTFTIKIKNKRGDLQLIDKFNGSDDYFNVLDSFLTEILKTPKKENDEKSNKINYHLTLSEPHHKILENEDGSFESKPFKALYGHFLSGVGGKKINIKETQEYKDVLTTDPTKHASFKKLFFFFYFSPSSKEAHLVLQREAKFGLKGVLTKILNKNLAEKGFMQSIVQVLNTIHGSVFQKMIEVGSLKRIDFIQKNIPKTKEDFMRKNGNFEVDKGVLKTSLISYGSLSSSWKNFASSLVNKKYGDKHRIDIDDSNNFYDEIEFELELNGKKKTFYVFDNHRVQPDVDVTDDVYSNDGNLDLKLMVDKSKELISELLSISINA